jgi:5-formyltetrahydrofolate cyclo-ligase
MKMNRDEARTLVWKALRKVAKPDSRFHWNFGEYIADYEGSNEGASLLRLHEVYRSSQVIFITPDNCMDKLREYALIDKKTLIMTTYGIGRGFQIIRPGDVPNGKEEFASTLDGIERYMKPIRLSELKDEVGELDMLVTGASAITSTGIRYGKGHGYFDLEWAMLWETNLIHKDTPVFAMGHECQVVDAEIEPSPYDTIVDYIVTPSKITKVESNLTKPSSGIIWGILTPEMIENIPPLKELQ